MSSKRTYKNDDNRDVCAEPHPEDGVPPQVLAWRDRRRAPGSVKAGRHRLDQLCKQVSIALGEALVCECGDPAIQGLEVLTVRPWTGSTVLQVTVRSPGADAAAIAHVHRLLRQKRVTGLLRAAVASAISRKRVPHLRFHVVA